MLLQPVNDITTNWDSECETQFYRNRDLYTEEFGIRPTEKFKKHWIKNCSWPLKRIVHEILIDVGYNLN